MSARSAAVLGFGLGWAVAMFVAAPFLAPFGIYVYERHLDRNNCRPVRAR